MLFATLEHSQTTEDHPTVAVYLITYILLLLTEVSEELRLICQLYSSLHNLILARP